MKKTVHFTMMSAILGLMSSSAAVAEVDCIGNALTLKHAVATDLSATLQIVEKAVTANPGCACEVVKAAIEGSKASVLLVAAIVETAATAAPEHLRLIAQCALAVAPDAQPNVQAVVAKLDPAKPVAALKIRDAKGGVAGPVETPVVYDNPLNFPGSGFDSYHPANGSGTGGSGDSGGGGVGGGSGGSGGGGGDSGGGGGGGDGGGGGGIGGGGGGGGGIIIIPIGPPPVPPEVAPPDVTPI
jgi:hypothetical protein